MLYHDSTKDQLSIYKKGNGKKMKKRIILRVFATIMAVTLTAAGVAGCNVNDQSSDPVEVPQEIKNDEAVTLANTQNDEPEQPQNDINAKAIVIVWYPNESAGDYEESRNELGRLIEQATGRSVEHRLTTDYVIAIESIASGAADIGAVFGAVGLIEAQQRNAEVQPLVVNTGASGTLDDAVYYAWLCVNEGEEDQYRSDVGFSLDNIQGKRMSFVSSSSTSGFRVPSSGIIKHFSQTAEWSDIDEDDILGLGSKPFFSEVLFGESHQGSLFNLIDDRADIAAVCDTSVDAYIERISGEHNTLGAVYAIQQDAAAPFEDAGGQRFVLIGVVPVLNGPIVYNPLNLSNNEVQAIRDILTSDDTANNPLIFGEEGEFSFHIKRGDDRYAVADNSWYDPLR